MTEADGNTVDRYINCLSLTIYTNDGPKDDGSHDFSSHTLTASADGNGFHYVCDCEASHLSDLKIIKDGVPFINTSFVEVESDNVVLTRTFTPDKPSTFMLPFSVSIAEVLGVALYEFQGDVTYNDETNEWETYVIDMTDMIEANKPYIAVPYSESRTFCGEDNLKFPTTAITSGNMVQRGTDEDPWQGSFVGLNEFKRWEAGDPEIGKAYGFAGIDKCYDDYAVAQGEFVKIAEGASAKPGRCYLEKNDGEMTLEGWFDLNGNKIEQPTKGGIYIHNNNKVMVK